MHLLGSGWANRPGKLPRREGIRGRIGFGITMRAHVSEGGRGFLTREGKAKASRERVKRVWFQSKDKGVMTNES